MRISLLTYLKEGMRGDALVAVELVKFGAVHYLISLLLSGTLHFKVNKIISAMKQCSDNFIYKLIEF